MKRNANESNTLSFLVLAGVGMAVVLASVVLCLCGTKSVINSIDSSAQDAIVQAKQTAEDESLEGSLTTGWTSEQINWMISNKITYNDYGLPVNQAGVIVDDPTTTVDETTIIDARQAIVGGTTTQPQTTNPQTQNNTVDSATNVQPDAGQVAPSQEVIPDTGATMNNNASATPAQQSYTVVKGDTLSKIAKTYGYTVSVLAEYNHIKNPNIIDIGWIINFPTSAVSGSHDAEIDTSIGLG